MTAAWFFASHGCLPLADASHVEAITKVINGPGMLGLLWLRHHERFAGAAEVQQRWDAQRLVDTQAAEVQRESQRLKAQAAASTYEASAPSSPPGSTHHRQRLHMRFKPLSAPRERPPRRWPWAMCLSLALCCSGCGTLAPTSRPPRVPDPPPAVLAAECSAGPVIPVDVASIPMKQLLEIMEAGWSPADCRACHADLVSAWPRR